MWVTGQAIPGACNSYIYVHDTFLPLRYVVWFTGVSNELLLLIIIIVFFFCFFLLGGRKNVQTTQPIFGRPVRNCPKKNLIA